MYLRLHKQKKGMLAISTTLPFDTIQDFLIALRIQTQVQLWPLVKNDP
jgi:hypothetical protein